MKKIILLALLALHGPLFAQESAEGWCARGVEYAESGEYAQAVKDFDAAIADYNHAIGIDQNNATLYLNRGNAYAEKGDHDRAITDYDQAITFDPNIALVYIRQR